MKRYGIALLLLAAAVSFAIAGGQGEAGSQKTAPTVRWLGVQHEWTDYVTKELPAFEQKYGIKVQFESYTEEQLSNKLAVESTAGSKSLDVFNFRPLQQSLLFSKNGWNQDLKGYYANDAAYDIKDFMPAAMGSVDVSGNVIAIPLIVEAEVLYYNKPLFKAKGLEVPKTQAEMYQVARELTDKQNGYYGVVSRGERSASVTQFSGYLFSNGGDYLTDGKASLTTPAAIKTFKFYGDMLRNYGPPGVLTMSWPQAANVFAQGKVGMYTDASSLYNAVASPEKSKIAGNVGVAMLPAGDAGSKPYNVCSWALAMGVNSQNKDAAWTLIKWLTSKEVMANAQRAGNSMARLSAWDDPANNTAFPPDYVATVKEAGTVGSPYDRPILVHVQQARDIIGTVINAGISGDNVEGAAQEAQAKLQELINTDNN